MDYIGIIYIYIFLTPSGLGNGLALRGMPPTRQGCTTATCRTAPHGTSMSIWIRIWARDSFEQFQLPRPDMAKMGSRGPMLSSISATWSRYDQHGFQREHFKRLQLPGPDVAKTGSPR